LKQRKKSVSPKTPQAAEKAGKAPPAYRAFYKEEVGDAEVEMRGFRSRLFPGAETKLLDYYGQNERPQGTFHIYAQLIVARNPFAAKEKAPRYVIILNGVSGPATFALTHVLTGGGNEEFESYRESGFDPAASSESILNKFLGSMQDGSFNCLECVIKVHVGEAPENEPAAAGSPKAPHTGAIFDWRRILSWTIDGEVLEREIRAR